MTSVDRVQRLLDLPLHRWLGLELADPGDPRAGAVLDVGDLCLGGAGLLHCGIVTAMLDVAADLRLLPELAEGEEAITHDASVSQLRSIRPGERLLLRADLLSKDSRRAYLRSSATVGGEAVALGQATKSLLRVT